MEDDDEIGGLPIKEEEKRIRKKPVSNCEKVAALFWCLLFSL